tara:strand:+ start:14719 stop:15108 length:390 start_codon:yes stop_codon:yes gene_type:complete
MVNIEAFSKRLKLILDYYNISATLLADKIEVQRSSISHILSGRNKPSLDFVLKILKSFPEVELYWLLNGVGEFPKNSETTKITPALPSSNKLDSNAEELQKPTITSEKISKIERIVVFYKDGTFKNYIP